MRISRELAAITLTVGLASAANAQTTIYGVANGSAYAENTDAGTSLELDADLSHFGFRGNSPITPTVAATFDARFYADIVEFEASRALEGHVGVEGDFGTIRLFGGPSPVGKTRSYYNLMDEDPTITGFILGGGMVTTTAVLPTESRFLTGLNYTSNELQGGLSFDGAVLPAQNPDGETGFSLAAHVDQPRFRASVGFEVNGVADNTQIVRLVGETDIGEITLGALLQMAGNSDADLSGTSVLGFAKMPLDVTAWPTRLRVSAGVAQQDNDADTVDESQVYLAAVHEIQFSGEVSAYSFGEVFLPEENDSNQTRLGFGMKVRF